MNAFSKWSLETQEESFFFLMFSFPLVAVTFPSHHRTIYWSLCSYGMQMCHILVVKELQRLAIASETKIIVNSFTLWSEKYARNCFSRVLLGQVHLQFVVEAMLPRLLQALEI